MDIPSRTKELLDRDQAYSGFVTTSLANLASWLNQNTLVFFPEFTDHSVNHLNEVLLSADSIITDTSWQLLTPQDAAALVISVLLHDCAMHISEDGFYTLINDQYPEIESRYVESELKWSELWLEFMAEAKRFNEKKLEAIFGDTEPVKDISTNKIELNGRDYRLIGEFLRRHHARLAHEIAINGVPGINGKVLQLGDEPATNFLDLCGFIARSHNMSLRVAVDKLEENKRREHLNTHVPFLMLVLRVADYIQIQSERAPESLLHIKTLVSPISRGEWAKHNSIVDVTQTHSDPEAIYVDAEPENAIIFESLSSLFSDIQSELDISWSVLGEVYGRCVPLNKLGITIRRIRSSLDDIDEYLREKKPSFIPKVLKFHTADSELIELLIAPLYGDKPEIGIRELLQNSVDACVELNDIVEKKSLTIEKNSDFDVSITLIDKGVDNGGKVVIEDFGVGMTLDVVEEYFLNIGASFRNSDRWKKSHEKNGHSDVFRTGRFGIGLLAAYLLGDEIQVETRHYSSGVSQGLKFNCKRSSESIIVSNTEFHIGTKVTIEINEEVKQSLIDETDLWDWYVLSIPKVVRKVISENGFEKILDQSIRVPSPGGSYEENRNWFKTDATGFDEVLWTYDRLSKLSYSSSGILVTCLKNLYQVL